MSQLVGLIHPYPIDHLATVLGHDVVQVKDDFRLRALFLLQNLTGRLVMSQLVGLIHPYPIDHLATVLGHDVVQVKDDFRLWALFLGTVPTGGNRL